MKYEVFTTGLRACLCEGSKKFITILLAITCIQAYTQTYLSKDFEDDSLNSGGWTTQVVVGTDDWTTFLFSGSYFGKVSNWDGAANNASETWLISPPVDLTTATSPILTFTTAFNFSGPALEVFVSTNYNGSGAPSTALWDTLNPALSTGSWTWVGSGNLDLSAYLTDSVFIAYKYTGSNADGSTWEVDDIIIDETGTTGAPSVTVYDIQYTTAPTPNSPHNGQVVITKGIVTAYSTYAHPTDPSKDYRGYFMQDGDSAWSGIWVLDTVNFNSVAAGDSVLIRGKVNEFFGYTRIEEVDSFAMLSTGNPEPATLVLSTLDANDEKYEGVLVEVLNATCDSVLGFGEWKVDDGSGDVTIDDLMYGFQTPVVGGQYNVAGCMFYSFSKRQLLPRKPSDVDFASGISEARKSDFLIYPNPSKGIFELRIKNEELRIENVEVYNALGELVLKSQVSNLNAQIDLSANPKGAYLLRVKSGERTFSRRVVVE
ncbi:MAG: hypothetical protein COA57_16485 [Flavobacteriales bacterium]|nr:MAG: hypothetical protein COA57_16485 [Flavobacteriales bacterium]